MTRSTVLNDDVFLEALARCKKFPTPSRLFRDLHVDYKKLVAFIGANPHLRMAMEQKGREYLISFSDEDFLRMVHKKKWTQNPTAYVKTLIIGRLDSLILKAINEFDGIPNSRNIARKLGINYHTITKRKRINKAMREAFRKKSLDFVQSSDKKRFLRLFLQAETTSAYPVWLKAAIRKRRNSIFLESISGSAGIPSCVSIAKSLGIAQSVAHRHFSRNRMLQRAIDARARTVISRLTDKEATNSFKSTKIVGGLSSTTRRMLNSRMDKVLFCEIRNFTDFPSAVRIGKASNLCCTAVSARIRHNRRLAAAQKRKVREYVGNLSDQEFLSNASNVGWIRMILPYGKNIIYGRLDRLIFRAIMDCEGYPNLEALKRALGPGYRTINGRLQKNRKLKDAFSGKRKQFIDNMTEEVAIACVRGNGGFGYFSNHAKEAIFAKVDAFILRGIKECETVPTPFSLSKALMINREIITQRMKKNACLGAAAIEQGISHVNKMPENEFISKASRKGGLPGAWPEEVRKAAKERIDRIVIHAIEEFEGIPNFSRLGKALGVSHSFFEHRVKDNPDVWIAYYSKRGLTEDQAIELALERGEQNNSTRRILSERLQNLYAFREMVAVARCFGDLLRKKVLEVSLYPEPLKKASDEIRANIDTIYADMAGFRRNSNISMQKADAAVLQSIQRLTPEGITRLFQSLRNALGSDCPVIATHSSDYAPSEDFLLALRENGFLLQERGLLLVEPPSEAIMVSLGTDPSKIRRMMEKMAGQSHVFVLKAGPVAGHADIPALAKMAKEVENRDFVPCWETITLPDGYARELRTKFLLEDVPMLSSAPFMVEVLEGRKKVAIIGYDMDPFHPKKVEVGTYDGFNTADFRKIARQLATKIESRNALGIKPGKETRVQMSQLRKLGI